MSFGFGLKAHSEVSERQPSHPLGGCEVEFVYATTELRMSWGPVLVSVLLLISGQSGVQLSYRNGVFYQLLDGKSKQKYFSFAIMNHGICLKQ